MAVFIQQIRMEWRIQFRRPFVWFCIAAFFAVAFSDTLQAGWAGQGQEWINGGAAIAGRAIIYSLLGAIAV
ncbi:MAG: hypothetical protein AAGA30_14230, partial [Planctomycetota bacterium]